MNSSSKPEVEHEDMEAARRSTQSAGAGCAVRDVMLKFSPLNTIHYCDMWYRILHLQNVFKSAFLCLLFSRLATQQRVVGDPFLAPDPKFDKHWFRATLLNTQDVAHLILCSGTEPGQLPVLGGFTCDKAADQE